MLAFAVVLKAATACAGWMPSADARMACCATDDPCPMHDPTGSGDPAGVTQHQADSCCAMSAHDDGAASTSVTVAAVTLVPVFGPAAHVVAPPSVAQLPSSIAIFRSVPVPKHLLLSVFLV